MEEIRDKNIFIVIPAFNEESIIQNVIKEVKNAGYNNIIVVDDGSLDKTSVKAEKTGAIVFQHFLNRGKGATVKTGIEAAKILGSDLVVTMDGDGQHNPKDIDKMIQLIKEGNDVILGTRLLKPTGMPFHRIIANKIGNFLTWALYGLWVTDSQSGFRAYSKKAFELIDTRTDRYEYDSEIIREIYHHKLRFKELPIEVRYTEYSTGKQHKMNLKNGIKILIKMLISS